MAHSPLVPRGHLSPLSPAVFLPLCETCCSDTSLLLSLSRSLSEECTPLKQRYDSCFNLWFEGYLQPALDAASLAQRGALPHVSSLDAMPDPAPPTPPPPPPASASASTPPAQSSSSSSSSARRHSLITSWANASVFRRRPAPAAHAAGHVVAADDMVSATHVHVDEGELEPLDTTDMTPSQAKAAEYERQCGKVWKEYQACLKVSLRRRGGWGVTRAPGVG